MLRVPIHAKPRAKIVIHVSYECPTFTCKILNRFQLKESKLLTNSPSWRSGSVPELPHKEMVIESIQEKNLNTPNQAKLHKVCGQSRMVGIIKIMCLKYTVFELYIKFLSPVRVRVIM